MRYGPQTKHWKMRNGEKTRICDMSDEHLLNCLKMLKRNAIRKHAVYCALAANMGEMLSGDIAQHHADQALIDAIESDWTEFLDDAWEYLMKETHHRGGAVEILANDIWGI